MTVIATLWCLIALPAAVLLTVFVDRRLRRFADYRTPEPADAELPRAAVILCLRGSDPFLNDCLAQLANQDYPDYEVRIVLDSPSDPARRLAEHWRNRAGRARIRISYLADISIYTSLKCNALVRGITQLDESVGAVVLADADTVAYPRWLRNMVAPLVAGDVGAVTGSRWYDPAVAGWGSLVRFVYNAYALVPMYLLGAVWPGSLALDRRVFARPDFIRCLLRAPCEDEAILMTLRETGLKLVNTPDGILLNRERCDACGCFEFVRRQLLWTRLSNRGWPRLLAGTVAVCTWLVAGMAIAALGLFGGHPLAGAATTAALFTIWRLGGRLLERLHRTAAERISHTTASRLVDLSWPTVARLAVGLALLAPFYAAAAVGATVVRRVRWRGVSYVVRRARSIELEQYVPYVGGEIPGAGTRSL